MVQFAAPGYLGSLKGYQTLYADPINSGRDATAGRKDLQRAAQAAANLRSKLSRILLRRTRDTVLKAILPPRSVRVLLCSMAARQRDLYMDECAEILSNASEDLIQQLDAKLIASEADTGVDDPPLETIDNKLKPQSVVGQKRARESDADGGSNGDLILAKLLSLRRICSTPTPLDLASSEEVSAMTKEAKV